MAKVSGNTSQNERDFNIWSMEETHHKVIELISTQRKGIAIDIPAGHGRLSWFLQKQGHRVIAGDINVSNFQNPGIPIVRLDVNKIFPFKDNAYDYVCCIEGPEHFENIYHVFRKFSRILKPGGKLILSCPNFSNLEARIRILFYGVVEPMTSKEQLKNKFKDNPGMAHINRPLYAHLKMALDFTGFKVETITTNRLKKKQLLLLPLFLLILFITKIKGEKGDYKYWLVNSNCYNVAMGGNSLILMCINKK